MSSTSGRTPRWVLVGPGLGETARVWILDVGGKRVTFLAHAYPGSGADAKAEFQKILDSVVFDPAS